MDWKEQIEQQLKVATEQRAISTELKALAKLLLDGDTEFRLIFLSGRNRYIRTQFKTKMGSKTKLLILKNHGIELYKALKV